MHFPLASLAVRSAEGVEVEASPEEFSAFLACQTCRNDSPPLFFRSFAPRAWHLAAFTWWAVLALNGARHVRPGTDETEGGFRFGLRRLVDVVAVSAHVAVVSVDRAVVSAASLSFLHAPHAWICHRYVLEDLWSLHRFNAFRGIHTWPSLERNGRESNSSAVLRSPTQCASTIVPSTALTLLVSTTEKGTSDRSPVTSAPCVPPHTSDTSQAASNATGHHAWHMRRSLLVFIQWDAFGGAPSHLAHKLASLVGLGGAKRV